MTITYSDVVKAHENIKPYIYRTPVLTNRHINEMVGAELFFKCENFQVCGAFKARGAYNAIFTFSDNVIKKGVVTHSSGNHAAAVAVAAARRGVPAYVVMPSNSPLPKKNAVKGYGAIVTECKPTLIARETEAHKIIEKTGAIFLHPYDNDLVIAGQGTAVKELIEDIGFLDIIICPVGGGGLLAGTALSTKQLLPAAQVIAAEPSGADDAKRSFEAGYIIRQANPSTIADGLLTSLGERNFEIIKSHVDEILTTTEGSIINAMRIIWQYMKIIVEPSSAVSLAMLLEHNLNMVKGKKIGIILTGGNVDIDRLPWMREKED